MARPAAEQSSAQPARTTRRAPAKAAFGGMRAIEVSLMLKTWGPHNPRRNELRRFRPKPYSDPPPWAGGIVVNLAYQAECEAYQRAEEARRRQDEEAAAQASSQSAKAAATSPVSALANAEIRLPRAVDYALPPATKPPTPQSPSPAPARRRLTARELRIARHSARCRVCRHPQCAAIERALIDWTTPGEIVKLYHLGSERALYRHGHVFGLFAERSSNHQTALGYLIEQVRHVKAGAAAIVSAIRLSSQLDRQRDD